MPEDQRIHTLFNKALEDLYGARRWSFLPANQIRYLGGCMVRAYLNMDKIPEDTDVSDAMLAERTKDRGHDAPDGAA